MVGHIWGFFDGASTFLTPEIAPCCAQDTFWGQKSLAPPPPKKTHKMTNYVFCNHYKTFILIKGRNQWESRRVWKVANVRNSSRTVVTDDVLSFF
jgi:hypothetical protein